MPLLDNPDIKRAALIIIGNEILTGRTQDANTQWIAERLLPRGIMLAEVRVVPDIEDKIIKAVNELRAEVDYVFTTGGIGPTHDDITAASVAKAFGVPLEINQEAYKKLEAHYGAENFTAPRKKMTMVPRGASLIPNPVSGAPGFKIENVHVMAGIPRIMQAMFDHAIEALAPGEPMRSRTVSCALAESIIAEKLTALQDRYPDIDIGSYPHFCGGVLGLSLVLRSTDETQLDRAAAELVEIVSTLGGDPQLMD